MSAATTAKVSAPKAKKAVVAKKETKKTVVKKAAKPVKAAAKKAVKAVKAVKKVLKKDQKKLRPVTKKAAKKAGKRRHRRQLSDATKEVLRKRMAVTIPLTPAMQSFMGGMAKCSRHEAVKKVWAYVKAEKLQKENDGRIVRVDSHLAGIFGKVETVHITQIPKLLAAHFIVEKKAQSQAVSTEKVSEEVVSKGLVHVKDEAYPKCCSACGGRIVPVKRES